MKNNQPTNLFTETYVAYDVRTEEVLFSGSGFYCDAMRSGNGGSPAVDPKFVVLMPKSQWDSIQQYDDCESGLFEDDADALASAGMGTDEDYGGF